MKISRHLILIFFLAAFLFCFSASVCFAGNTGKLYILGMGPSGPDLTAPRAIAILEKADTILCSSRMQKRFWKHVDPNKVAFNPWEGIHGEEAGKLRKTDYQKWIVRVEKQKKKIQTFVLQHIKNGKTVAMLDGGDPCVYGPSLYWLLKGFDDRYFEIIPGMSAFNAASAALKRPMTGENTQFVMLTAPFSLFGDSYKKADEVLQDLSKYKTTMVFYMALSSMDKLVEKFKKYYPPELPMAVVYYAGYPEKEKVLRSMLGTILDDLKKVDEKWLGLLIIGECAK
ncbi:MAG: SAM-dependent methyltransferase [Deltaproteobacteria bacterium]|jgi:precorrin-4 methylase|nr:SAM-dependent methyltransferase [Deltaproteobacteria bacterium]